MKKSILSLLMAAGVMSAMAQLAPFAIPNTAKPLEVLFNEKYVKQHAELQQVLADRNLPEVTTTNGTIVQAMYVTQTGHIVYNTTTNTGAGKTLSTNKVWPGGVVGTSLTGANMPNRLGVWDGGAVRVAHQEFGTTSSRVTQTDGASSLIDHATHVAGTMIATGVDTDAKGMAYMATLKAYDWNNDNSEMSQAAALGMLISNHSYGNVCGWYYDSGSKTWSWYGDRSMSTTEDYKFGWYNDAAQDWDDIAISNPYYLICKAAGNDRGDYYTGSNPWSYSDGTPGGASLPLKDGGVNGYDCISTYGTAKNILTVGAVNKIGGNNGNGWTKTSDVVMSSFSGWGPTDDGRIKPDVVSPGVDLYSTLSTSNTAYGKMSGTSMATPAASGSLILVQQHYNNIKGKFMRSASLKGLAIHTADEAGTTAGPDYKFGWGLLNTASAVVFLNDSNTNKLEEKVLSNGTPQNVLFSADAGKPLKVTISWTDKSGTPVTSNRLNNPTKMLVNDLDIRLTRMSDNMIFYPYILDPANPNNAATTGDNTRDNVEMIYLATPDAGNYTLTVSNKGNIVGTTQPYTLLISNAAEKSSAQFTASQTTICPGQSITFSDKSTGAVAQRSWSFPGGTPSTSTVANPVITYNTPGTYAVILKVTGSLGSDSIYKADFITVGGMALPFAETFESNSPTLSSWTVANPDAAATWGLSTTGGTIPGNSSAGIILYDYSTKGQRDGLISPSLNLSSHANVNLTFSHAYTRYGSASNTPSSTNTDSLIVYASTNCGSTWVRLQGFGESGTGNFATYQDGSFTLGSQSSFAPTIANDWCGAGVGSGCKTISLAQFAGQSSVTLKFESYNNYGNNLYIDNIAVNGTLLTPIASFQAKTTVCVDEVVTFTDKSTRSPANWNWTFTGANTPTSNLKNPLVSYASPGIYNVKLVVSNVSGADSIELNNYITVVPKPTTPNIKAIGATAFCIGDSVLLITDSIGNFKWYKDDVLIAQNVNEIYAKVNATYRVAKSNGTCEASSSILVSVNSKPIKPTYTSSVTGNSICDGSAAILTSVVNDGNQWLKNNQAITGATNKTYGATDAGSYSLITKKGGCISDTSLVKIFTISPRPTVSNITGEQNPVRGESNPYSVTTQSGLTYAWIITNGTILNGNGTAAINARFNVVDTASLKVVSTNTLGCKSLSEVINVSVSPAVGLNEVTGLRNITVYPIPAKTILNIALEGMEQAEADLNIVNLLGQVVQTQKINLNTKNHAINISGLHKGIYLIELQSSKIKLVKRIVIE